MGKESQTDLTNHQIIEILLKDRSELREGLKTIHTFMQALLVGFPAVVAALATRLFDKGPTYTCGVGFLLSQLMFLLMVYVAMLSCGGGIHAGYMRCLEERINKLASVKLAIWETEVGEKFYAWPSTFTLAMIVFGVFLVSAYIALIAISAQAASLITNEHSVIMAHIGIKRTAAIIISVGIAEFLGGGVLLLRAVTEENRVYLYVKKRSA